MPKENMRNWGVNEDSNGRCRHKTGNFGGYRNSLNKPRRTSQQFFFWRWKRAEKIVEIIGKDFFSAQDM
jgi:hypothetical protein